MKRFWSIKSLPIRHALRAALAVSLGTLVYRFWNIDYGFWVMITALIVMQASLGASIKRAKLRVLGTVLGVLTGAILSAGFSGEMYYVIVSIPVLLFLIVYTWIYSYAYTIFFGTVLLMVLMGQGQPDPWHFAIARLMDTAIGVVIGLLVSALFWPRHARHDLKESSVASLEICRDYYRAVTESYLKGEYDVESLRLQRWQLESALAQNRVYFEDFHHEPRALIVPTDAIGSFLLSQQKIYGILMSMQVTARHSAMAELDEDVKQSLQRVLAGCDDVFQALIGAALEKGPLPGMLVLRDLWQDSIKTIQSWEQEHGSLIYAEHNGMNVGLFLFNVREICAELKFIRESIRQFL